MRVGCNSVMVEKNISGAFYDFNVFVFGIQKWTSACISPLYACFFISKSKHATVFLTRNYGTWQYTIFKLGCEIRSERLYYTYLDPPKLPSLDIESIGYKTSNSVNISTVSGDNNSDKIKNTSIQTILLSYILKRYANDNVLEIGKMKIGYRKDYQISQSQSNFVTIVVELKCDKYFGV